MVTLTTDRMFLVFTCTHFLVWRILQRYFGCAPTACEVVHDCRKFEKHCFIGRRMELEGGARATLLISVCAIRGSYR
jgi:hypothetical protein